MRGVSWCPSTSTPSRRRGSTHSTRRSSPIPSTCSWSRTSRAPCTDSYNTTNRFETCSSHIVPTLEDIDHSRGHQIRDQSSKSLNLLTETTTTIIMCHFKVMNSFMSNSCLKNSIGRSYKENFPRKITQDSVITPRWNKALWLVKRNHMTWTILTECFISL